MCQVIDSYLLKFHILFFHSDILNVCMLSVRHCFQYIANAAIYCLCSLSLSVLQETSVHINNVHTIKNNTKTVVSLEIHVCISESWLSIAHLFCSLFIAVCSTKMIYVISSNSLDQLSRTSLPSFHASKTDFFDCQYST